MSSSRLWALGVVVFVATTVLHGCELIPDGDGDVDVDIDGDVDDDVDVDVDADADADLDGTGGMDAGQGDAIPTGVDCGEGDDDCDRDGPTDQSECNNGIDEDGDLLLDCAELTCRDDPLCCEPAAGSIIPVDFAACETPQSCGWTEFSAAADGDAVSVDAGTVRLGGDGVGEVGLFSLELPELSGEPIVTFVGALAEASCPSEGCRQALGVVFTRDLPTPSSGVSPYVGVVLDGERNRVAFYVDGRLDGELPAAREQLVAELAYGFRVHADGAVSFWAGRELTDDGLPPELLEPADHPSAARLDLTRSRARLALFGRLEGADAAALDSIGLERDVCDVPGGWSRSGSAPVLVAAGGQTRAAAPSVVFDADGGLLMAYEGEADLMVATSADGTSWESEGPLFTEPPTTGYGTVARRAPALLVVDAPLDGEGGRYHLWYEAEAEAGAGTPTGARPTAIVHAVSADGLAWVEASQPIALLGSWAPEELSGVAPAVPGEVADPAVVAIDGGGLRMFFVVRDPSTGDTRLHMASSADATSWVLSPSPLDLGASAGGFDADGVAGPTAIYRDRAIHLWYEGRRGASSAIGYALSGDGTIWTRVGEVLGPADRWESGRVGAPSVEAVPFGEATGQLSMYFAAGAPGLEAIGLAARQVPLRD